MIHPLDLSGRNILVTGASSGIGRETALHLSRLGARVVLSGRDEKRLAETLGGLAGLGHAVAPLDLAAGADLNAWFRDLAQVEGPFQGLVHSAGQLHLRPLRALTPEILRQQFEINVMAAAGLVRGFRQRGVRGEPASAVLVSSVMGQVGQPAMAAYAASKGALEALSRALALELAREGIRVNCVAAGMVESQMAERARETLGEQAFAAITAMHPLGLGRPSDVAHAIAFLLADTGRWITGTTLVVDGGYTAA